jgi:hypothetical protein
VCRRLIQDEVRQHRALGLHEPGRKYEIVYGGRQFTPYFSAREKTLRLLADLT